MVKFGTSGLRGLASDLTDALASNFASAFLSGVTSGGQVLIGRDLRDSSPRLVAAVAAGARRAGVEPVDCGVLPTPALALAAEDRKVAAIMVTGSHIPGDRNGLKFYDAGQEITKADEAWLLRDASKYDDAPLPAPDPMQTFDALGAFRARFAAAFGPAALAGLRVGVYQHSSVARDLMPKLIEDLGGTAVALGRSEGFVAVDTEAVSEDARRKLATWAAQHRLDAIISTDGDADRPMLADETGQIIPGDRLGPITARFLGADVLVTPVSSNTLVDLMADWTVPRTRIGSPFVIEEMQSHAGRRVVGYEPNGGFLLGFTANIEGRSLPPLMTRDFALPILAVLSSTRQADVKISALSAALPARFTATDRLTDVPQTISKAITDAIVSGDFAALPEGARDVAALDTTDGARLTLSDGRILTIRASGNAPELRCYAEATTNEAAIALMSETLARLRTLADQP